jgi:excisionase family DNA binding protein
MEERLLTTEDVSEYLRVDVVTVRRLINRGDLIAYRIAGEFRFTKGDLEDFVKSQRVIVGEGKKDPFERFTERARKVLSMAESEARHYHHPAVGTEHLLLALILEGGGIGARTLINAGISGEQIRQEVELLHPLGEESESSPELLAMTPRSKKVITLAVEEARTLGHHYLGTEHLLLGLIRMKEGLAEQILSKLGITYEQSLEEIKRLLAAK